MTATVTYTTVGSATWVAALTGVTWAMIQLQSDGPVRVAVAASDPGAGNTDGVILEPEGLCALPLNGIEATDTIYLRAFEDGETETVCVIG